MEIELGKEALKKGTEYVNKRMDKASFKHLRGYFNVDNTFVFRKIALMFFPFSNAEWTGEDENGLSRPELYIPVMGFVSYILVRALYLGLDGKFSPEKLGIVFSRCMFLEMFCICFIKVSGYFVDVSLHSLDIVAYNGYKYVSILLLSLCRMRYVRIVFSLYLYVGFFFFLSRSLKRQIISGDCVNRTVKIYYLFSIVLVQMAIIFQLS